MANTFKRVTSKNISNSLVDVYTVPAGITTVVIGTVISNLTPISANVQVIINDGASDINVIGVDTPIPPSTALSFLEGKMVMQAGDIMRVKGSDINQLDVHISIMESD